MRVYNYYVRVHNYYSTNYWFM